MAGLSQSEAANRLAADGPNELNTDQHDNLLKTVLEVAAEPMFLLLLGSGAIYFAMGDSREAYVLLGFVVIIMAISIIQTRKTETTLAALRDLSSPRALVIRDGKPIRIAGQQVVRGDLVMLAEGDRIPADGLVLEAHELAVDESLLTGESEMVNKAADISSVYAGSLTVRGQGLVRVSATGSDTELGKIGKSLQNISVESSPLRGEINLLTKRLVILGISASLLLTALYWTLRGGWLQGLLSGIVLAMSLIPQELPVIMIVFFALGARRIAAHHVLTRRLNAIETLGETTVLCVDKTGTLTENRMEVSALSVAGKTLDSHHFSQASLSEAHLELIEYALLASEIAPNDPMELAFHRLAQTHLDEKKHKHSEWQLAREYELSPELLAMSHLWRNALESHDTVATKGAPEAIAELCQLSPEQHSDLMRSAEKMASKGLRVLAVAKAHHASHLSWPALQTDFEFSLIGLIGLADPLRVAAKSAIAECHQAGIRVIMITGDHPTTAKAIASQAGINCSQILTGKEMAAMSKAVLQQRMSYVHVFARVTPHQKLTIVEYLKAQGEVVAMTGDGVNDAPALKAAHIGIAMGNRGTDVAREAASIVLLRDDFSSIVSAISLGRRIFSNLRQAIIYTLAVHVPIIGLTILPLLFGLPLLLAPIHIAFLELVIDPACSIVFEAEEPKTNLMRQAPRPKTEHLVSRQHILLSLSQGLMITLVTAGFYTHLIHTGEHINVARALTFIVLVTANATLVFSSRSLTVHLRGLFSDVSRVGMVVLLLTMLGLIIVTSIPSFSAAFNFHSPSLLQWLLAFVIGISLLPLFECMKALHQRLRQ
jgi:Ca2+-transporting ATPase